MTKYTPRGPVGRAVVALFAFASAAACSAAERAGVEPDAGSAVDLEPIAPTEGTELDEDACTKMDVLFVVDNSGSMAEEQASLAANFAMLTQKLDAFTTRGGAALDYRIAVTTTARTIRYTMQPELPGFPPFPEIPSHDFGDDGRLLRGCSMERPWLERGEPSLASRFSCVANVGTGGSPLEMPLEALRLAVTDRVTDGANAGFLRDDALLAAVIITDEDDCSRRDNDFFIKDDTCPPGTPGYEPPADYVAALDAAKGGRERWAAAVIAGPTECQSGFGAAMEAKRLKDFVGKTGQNGVFSSICLGDLVTPLENALNVFDAACRKFTVK